MAQLESKVIREISERTSSEFNVIVYGLPELSSSSTNQRNFDDRAKLSNALSPIKIDLPTDSK